MVVLVVVCGWCLGLAGCAPGAVRLTNELDLPIEVDGRVPMSMLESGTIGPLGTARTYSGVLNAGDVRFLTDFTRLNDETSGPRLELKLGWFESSAATTKRVQRSIEIELSEPPKEVFVLIRRDPQRTSGIHVEVRGERGESFRLGRLNIRVDDRTIW